MHSPVCSTFHFRRSSFAPSPAPFERTKDQRYVCAKKLHDLKYINVNKSSRSHSSFLMRTWPFRRRPIHLRSSRAARIFFQLHPFRIMQLAEDDMSLLFSAQLSVGDVVGGKPSAGKRFRLDDLSLTFATAAEGDEAKRRRNRPTESVAALFG